MSIRRDANHRPLVRLTDRLRDLCEQQKRLINDAEGAMADDDRVELKCRIDKVDDYAFGIHCDEIGAGHDDHLADMEP